MERKEEREEGREEEGRKGGKGSGAGGEGGKKGKGEGEGTEAENLPRSLRLTFLSCHDIWGPIICTSEKAMAPHSSTLAWEIPWTEEPGGLRSMESLRIGHD